MRGATAGGRFSVYGLNNVQGWELGGEWSEGGKGGRGADVGGDCMGLQPLRTALHTKSMSPKQFL